MPRRISHRLMVSEQTRKRASRGVRDRLDTAMCPAIAAQHPAPAAHPRPADDAPALPEPQTDRRSPALRWHVLVLLAGLLLAALLTAGVSMARPASNITVNSLADNTTDDAECTLREAINNANTNFSTYDDCVAGSGSDTILFSVSGTITLTAILPAVADNLVLDGPGADSLTISGNRAVGLLQVNVATSLDLRGLTLANGAAANGGGIFNLGTLTISNSSIAGNTATLGGGISNQGTLTISSSTLSGNTASNNGGAIANDGTLTISNSTISGNQASLGGGIWNDSTVTISSSTLSGNTASTDGASIYNINAFSSSNSIVASASTSNCNGPITDKGNNLQHPGASCGAALRSADPLLGALSNHGGPTLTHVLLPGSPALDAGPASGCPASDQRGVTRPRDANADSTALCDIGAVELHVDLRSTLSPAPASALPGQPVAYQLSYTNVGADTARGLVLQATLPAALTAVTTAPTLNQNPAGAGWLVPDLPPGGSATISIQGTVVSTLSADTNLTLVATLQSPIDTTATDNTAQATIAVRVPRVQFATLMAGVAEEAGSVSIEVTLDGANPYAPVQVNVNASGGTATATDDYTLPGQLSLPAGQTSASLNVTLVNDLIDEDDETLQLVLSAPSGAVLGSPSSMTLTLLDDDGAGVRVLPISGLVTTESGGSASFTVVLTSQPLAEVSLTLSSSNSNEGQVEPTTLTFSSANWDVAQTVTVSGVDDLRDDGDVAYSIITSAASSSDSEYNQRAVSDIGVINLDDDLVYFMPMVTRVSTTDEDEVVDGLR